ncbi:hypothetical protein [Lysinibacillus fusiformis]|nr:hypothetical protein [Lysinibacillus fusiformis]
MKELLMVSQLSSGEYLGKKELESMMFLSIGLHLRGMMNLAVNQE